MNDTDFLALYQELGLGPDDGLDAFRRAYRRRVARLHPDRTGSGDPLELQALNVAYARAMDFHARYGRLPGSMPCADRHAAPRSFAAMSPEAARPKRSRLAWTLGLPVAALATWLFVDWQLQEGATQGSGALQETTSTAPRADADPHARLRLGMSGTEALAIQGEPVIRNDSLWQWGPSWIAFECGVVSDWYSSRLRPLKVATSVPTDTERRTVPRPRCAAASALPPGTPP